MAWRIEEHVRRGEIDNRVRGKVTGTIWLEGEEAPLVLNLQGDCQPDLAGCFLRFENPAPVPLVTRPPAAEQNGQAGDITAARKVRVFDMPVPEAYALLKAGGTPPEHLANALYLEWFSRWNGRVVIESTAYHLEVSEPAWRFTAEELNRRADNPGAADGDTWSPEEDEPWDEFRAEQLLRESDLIGERYRRLLEEFHDHPDGEAIIAREMGWTDRTTEPADDLPDDPAADGPAEEFEPVGDEVDDEPPPDPDREGIDWVHDRGERIMHPVAKRARDLLDPLLAEMRSAGDENDPGDEPFFAFVSDFMTVSVKLSAHLGFIARPDGCMDPALLIAWLKRDVALIHRTLTALDALSGHLRFPEDRHAHFRAELFTLRASVLEVITRLRGS
jgi:hypothetical protein